VQQGEEVAEGLVLMRLLAKSEGLAASMAEEARAAVVIGEKPPDERELVLQML
jgi:thymidine phosphorylase